MSTPRRRRGRPLRDEVQILLPLALLVLIALSSFTLFSYRGAITTLTQERRAEAARVAGAIARVLQSEVPDGLRLQEAGRRAAPQMLGLALLDEHLGVLIQTGLLSEGTIELPDGVSDATGIGPNRAVGDVVVAVAPLAGSGEARYLRLDLPSIALARQIRTVRLLTGLVLSVNALLFASALIFLRQLMAPYETLLARARTLSRSQSGERGPEDEVELLLTTFDRAIEALSRPQDDIAALERTLAPSLESGLLLLDDQANVLALNGIGSSLLGLEETVIGRSLEGAFDRQPALLSRLVEAVRSERGVQRRECSLEVGGRTLTLGITVHPLRRKEGARQGWLVLFADLTKAQRRAQERRLSESLARLGEITAGVAHEMRNSLGSLRGYLTLLEREAVATDSVETIQEIRHEADHLQRVLEDFLSFARPGSARLEEVDLLRLAHRAAADLAMGRARITVQPPQQALPVLIGDPQLLERALRNLVHNAVQAHPQGEAEAQVELDFEVDEDELRIRVMDRGGGVPEELRGKLFVPFTTGRAGGVGLGLALTHRIVDLHGGRVRLEDRGGGGTRAIVTFPSDRFATKGSEPLGAEAPEPAAADVPTHDRRTR